MKEVFTKSFWQDVKKTFDQAREDPAPGDNATQAPAKGALSTSTSETPLPPSVPSETSGTSR
ncbi:MAG: hypothetical protein ACLPWF_28410 [Bryobacteraceae bacterium]|jgi:hypothetical protein